MKCMNKVQLIGYLGKDPEIKEFGTGNSLATFRLATDSLFRHSSGKMIKRTEWHTVKLWGDEPLLKFSSTLIKGSHILVEGQLVYKKIKTRSGQLAEVADINAYLIIDLDR